MTGTAQTDPAGIQSIDAGLQKDTQKALAPDGVLPAPTDQQNLAVVADIDAATFVTNEWIKSIEEAVELACNQIRDKRIEMLEHPRVAASDLLIPLLITFLLDSTIAGPVMAQAIGPLMGTVGQRLVAADARILTKDVLAGAEITITQEQLQWVMLSAAECARLRKFLTDQNARNQTALGKFILNLLQRVREGKPLPSSDTPATAVLSKVQDWGRGVRMTWEESVRPLKAEALRGKISPSQLGTLTDRPALDVITDFKRATQLLYEAALWAVIYDVHWGEIDTPTVVSDADGKGLPSIAVTEGIISGAESVLSVPPAGDKRVIPEDLVEYWMGRFYYPPRSTKLFNELTADDLKLDPDVVKSDGQSESLLDRLLASLVSVSLPPTIDQLRRKALALHMRRMADKLTAAGQVLAPAGQSGQKDTSPDGGT